MRRRISVGLCAAALGYTGYLKALAYARERLQGRPAGASPTSAQVPLVTHPDVRRMLLAQKSYVEGALALSLFSARLVDDAATLTGVEARDATRLLGLITPIAKSWPSQWCVAANDLAIQVMGGAGYTRDYDVEQHYRDNRLNAIHEGTHGIQALDLLGRKVLAEGGVGLALLASRILSTVERAAASGPDGAALAGHLKSAVGRLVSTTELLVAADDRAAVLAEATTYLEAAGHLVVAWLWLEQWVATVGKEDAFYQGKRLAARYFITRELPRIDYMLDVLTASDGLLLALDPEAL
jgi:butyryl-CoA dehydrogenase